MDSSEFKILVEKLHRANPRAVYLWIDGTNEFGTIEYGDITRLTLKAISEIRSEIVFFRTEDAIDSVLFDVHFDGSSHVVIEIELWGDHWSNFSAL